MAIFYFLFEAIPHADNPERQELAGAYITCWVNSIDFTFALPYVTTYINNEGWKVINVEEQFVANRERYEGDDQLDESLACFDQAVNDGIAARKNHWNK